MIVIVGAGVAGLWAAVLLKRRGFKVKIIEASDRVLGRIYTLREFADIPIELGAEFMHGKKSTLFKLAHADQKVVKTTFKPLYFYKNSRLTLRQLRRRKTPQRFIDFWTNIWRYKSDSDVNLREFLEREDFYTPALQHIIEGFTSEYGTSTTYLDLKSLAQEENQWSSGESNYRLPNGYDSVFKDIVEQLEDDLILKTPVDFIGYWGADVLVGSRNQRSFQADKVILTVPLPILKQNTIKFEPTLSTRKQKAINALGMGTGMKVILKFKQRFWKKGQVEIFGGWLCPLYYSLLGGENLLMAYIMGDKARFLTRFQDDDLIELLLQDLRFVFFKRKIELEDARILNWEKQPYINGTYSYATSDSPVNRHILAEPIDNKIFFAGEAVNTKGHAATVHGAMERAEEVVDGIVELENHSSS